MRETWRRALTDPSKRTLALLGAMIVLVIVGLLGMHALNGSLSHAAAGDPGSGLTTSLQAPGAVHGAGQPGADAHCSDGCAAPVPGHTPDMPQHAGIAACMLVLLAGLILLVPRASGALTMLRQPMLSVPTDPPGLQLARSTPDLTFLLISRT